MYEVATSLCRLLFNTYKVHDAFLFMTILSTDLHALRRRGFKGNYEASFINPANWISVVDRILRQQEAEREATAKVPIKKADKRAPTLHPSAPPEPGSMPAPIPVSVPTPVQTYIPDPNHSGDTVTDQLGVALKTDLPIDGDSEGESLLYWMDIFVERVSVKLQLSKSSDKGPQIPEVPTTDSVMSSVNIGGLLLWPLELVS